VNRSLASILPCLCQLALANVLAAQVLTHGPVVGGVTDTGAKVFARTDVAATVAIRYGTDPALGNALVSESIATAVGSDYTAIVPLTSLVPETTYYLDILVNDVSQLAAPFPFFTTFAPPGASRDFKFIVLTDFVSVSQLDATVQTFDNASALQPAFAFIGGDFDHRGPTRLTERRRCSNSSMTRARRS
jgi:phosphodiesterase/alkaline phosphatase D-like protein